MKFSLLLTQPTAFFREQEHQLNYLTPLLLFVCIQFLLALINSSSITKHIANLTDATLTIPSLFIVFGITFFVYPFLQAWIIYLSIRHYNSQALFKQVFTISAYSSCIILLYRIIVSLLYLGYLQLTGTPFGFEALPEKTGQILLYFAFATITSVIYIGGILHSFIVLIMGTQYFFDLKLIPAVTASIVIPVIIVFILSLAVLGTSILFVLLTS